MLFFQSTKQITPILHAKSVKPTVNVLATALALVTATIIATASQAQPLPQVWQSALRHSADAQLIDAQLAQAQARGELANSLYKPKIMLQGSLGYGDNRMQMVGATFSAPSFASMGMASVDNAAFKAKANNAVVSQLSLMAQQPLYSPKLSAQAAQIRLGTQMGRIKAELNKNQLILGVAKQYYDLAVAQTSVKAYQKQHHAAQSMLDEAKFRFKIGDAPITGVHEATANLAMIDARIAAAQSQVQSLQAQLTEKTGLIDIHANLPVIHQDAWLAQANDAVPLVENVLANNLSLKLAKLNEQLAQQSAAEQKPWASLSVNAVGMFSRHAGEGKGYGGDGEITQQNAMLGVQASVPLYTGGAQTANYRALQQGVVAAQYQLEQSTGELRTQTLTYANNQRALTSQLQALTAAYKAGELRLDATQTGKKVGDKTLLEVLNAQNDLVTIELEIAKVQVNLAMTKLTLAMLTNQLMSVVVTE